MPTLELCSGCDRHVRMDEATCPFCGAARASASEPSAVAPLLRGLGRAGRMAVATSALAGIAGCASGAGSTANTDPTSTAAATNTEAVPTNTEAVPTNTGEVRPPRGGDDGSIPRPYGAPPARKPRFV